MLELEQPKKIAAIVELLNEVAASSIEWDAGKYVTVQIDKDTWEALSEIRENGENGID